MWSGVAGIEGRGVVVISIASRGISNGLKRVCLLLFVFWVVIVVAHHVVVDSTQLC